MEWINEETIISGLKVLDQIIAIYIVYKIEKHLIKFGIDYFFEKKYTFHQYKEANSELNDIEADLRQHREGDR